MASVNDGVWPARKPSLAPVQRLAYICGGILRDGRIGDGVDILLRACPLPRWCRVWAQQPARPLKAGRLQHGSPSAIRTRRSRADLAPPHSPHRKSAVVMIDLGHRIG
jgi:hypothetical protein